MSQPSLTNCPKLSAAPDVLPVFRFPPLPLSRHRQALRPCAEKAEAENARNAEKAGQARNASETRAQSGTYQGGYGGGVPPLPIPNREVKPARADGTASSGRVGSRRLLLEAPSDSTPEGLRCFWELLHDPSLPSLTSH